MPQSSSRIKGLVIVWSLILLGGYVLLAGGAGLLPSSKSARVLHDDTETTEPDAAPATTQSAPATQFSLQTNVSKEAQSVTPATRQAPTLMSGSKSGIILKPSQVQPTGDSVLSIQSTTRP